ncbi:hypothetical protein D3C76_591170 [compost metagenome]
MDGNFEIKAAVASLLSPRSSASVVFSQLYHLKVTVSPSKFTGKVIGPTNIFVLFSKGIRVILFCRIEIISGFVMGNTFLNVHLI